MIARMLSARFGVLSLVILSSCSGELKRSSSADGSGDFPSAFDGSGGLDRPTASDEGVSVPDAPLPKGFIIISGLSLDRSAVKRGDTLKGTVTYLNNTDAPVTVVRLTIANRPPGGTHSGGPYLDLAPELTAQTVQPGATVTLTASRVFADSDPYGKWEAYPTWSSGNDVWNDGPSVYYQVGDASVLVDSGAPADKRSPDTRPVDRSTVDGGCLKPGCVYAGHKLPALRGKGSWDELTAADIQELAQVWKANVLRWDMGGVTGANLTSADYETKLQAAITKLDAAIPVCKQYGLLINLNPHSFSSALFASAAAQDRLVSAWKVLAAKYKGNDVIWAYDIANEPVEPEPFPSGVLRWNDLAEKIAKEIRAIDPVKTIMVEAPNWDLPSGFNGFRPIAVPNVIYSVHVYEPHNFTCQTLPGLGGACEYPGVVDGVYWDKTRLEASLKPAYDFAQKNNVHMYVGEFSAIRWAPNNSGYRYLKDCIELFEKYGWDWTYHSWRWWDGWSAEHTDDQSNPNPGPSDRGQLLKDWFAKNQKP